MIQSSRATGGTIGSAQLLRLAARYAVAVLIIGLVVQYALVLGIAILVGFVVPDFSVPLPTPLYLWVTFHGVVGSVGLWLSGLTWLAISFWLGAVYIRGRTEGQLATATILGRFALASGLIYTVLVWLIAVGLDTDIGTIADNLGAIAALAWGIRFDAFDVAPAVGYTFIVATSATALFFGWSLITTWLRRRPVGRVFVAATIGGSAALLVGVAGASVFVAASNLIDWADVHRGLFETNAYAYSTGVALASMAWIGPDVGFALVVDAMGLLRADLYEFAGETKPLWGYLATIPAGLGYLVGGYLTSRSLNARTAGTAALAGAAAGVAAWFIAVALSGFAAPNPEGLTVQSVLKPPLWIPLAVLGGLAWRPKPGTRQS